MVAHQRKTLGGGLDELRRRITDEGVDELFWYEVPKSKKAPKQVRRALGEKPDLLIVWGGDGMVQRTLDTIAGIRKNGKKGGAQVPVGIIPAGTANMLAGNLGVPDDLAGAVHTAFHGRRHRLDLGVLNGEHFAVMAGIGFDGAMIHDADGTLKDRLGKLSYVWTGLRHLDDAAPRARVTVDGTEWFTDEATCVLIGNVSMITGGITAFDDAKPDDGWLDVGVATARGAVQWARTMGQMAVGRSADSPFVHMTRARRIDVKLREPLMYELDGGSRKAVKKIRVEVAPAAVKVCVPRQGSDS
ncbi:diacylglycerol/lipid kinase family protein [Couchioplanes caeruleus]|uniref:YegS/Rv2252/BmrU family lipid kinase n=1 Tax=Couchioplanes caeruleus TaxID=56438 RepID=A0A3N1GR53_9ACTN|nr:YegS/Rv2252/BmrU family lipid kinase [Couchioplanes caeruleus]ROP32727.1 YegS/Rv2252/BmrU family lipid kinase [Couchioplanes caeruleus]